MLVPGRVYLISYPSGFHGDLNGTYPVGKITEENAKLIRTARHSLDEAIKLCKPGALFRDIGKTMSVVFVCAQCRSLTRAPL